MASPPLENYGSSFTLAGASKLDVSVDVLQRMMSPKVMAGRKSDQVGVVLSGTEETSNPLADNGDGYENVVVHQSIEQPTVQLLRSFKSLKPSSIRGDVISGLVVAVDLLISHCKKLKFEKKVYVFTDGESPIDREGAEEIASVIRDNLVEVTFIGIDFSIGADNEDEELEAAILKSPSLEGVTTKKMEAEYFLYYMSKKLLEDTNSVLFTMREAYEEMERLHVKKVSPVTTFRGDLNFGEQLAIQIFMYSRTMQAKLPAAKKVQVEKDQHAGSVHIEKLSMMREYRVTVDDDPNCSVEKQEEDALKATSSTGKKPQLGHAVSREQISKVYKYGSSVITVTPAEEALMEREEVRGLWVLGSLSVVNLPREIFLSNISTVIPQPDNARAEKLFTALVHALIDLNQVLIVRFCKNETSNPKLAALLPVLKAGKYQCMYFIQLPFANDLRDLNFFLPINTEVGASKRLGKTLLGLAPTFEQEEAASNFIDSLNLMNCLTENGEAPYKSRHVFNPQLHYMNMCIEFRAMKPERSLPPPPDMMIKPVSRLPELFDQKRPALLSFSQAFTLELVPPKPTKRKRLEQTGVKYETVEDLLAKEERLSQQAKRNQIVNQVQAAARNPLEAFEKLMNREDDLVSEAVSMLSQAILEALRKGPTGNSAALSYLRALRQACLDENEYERFNALMYEISGKFMSQFMPLLKAQGFSLISSLDSENCETKPEDAKTFLENIEGGDEDATETETEDEEES